MQLPVELTAKNVTRHELLGLKVDVEWKHGKQPKFSGIVVGETKNMLDVQSPKGKRLFPKTACMFSFKLPDGSCVKVDGTVLLGRPEDRLKKVVRKW
ncbi:MAG: ribonuclease P protein subunit [Nitrososphaerota archaeon]